MGLLGHQPTAPENHGLAVVTLKAASKFRVRNTSYPEYAPEKGKGGGSPGEGRPGGAGGVWWVGPCLDVAVDGVPFTSRPRFGPPQTPLVPFCPRCPQRCPPRPKIPRHGPCGPGVRRPPLGVLQFGGHEGRGLPVGYFWVYALRGFQTFLQGSKKFPNVSKSFQDVSKRFKKFPRSFQMFPNGSNRFPNGFRTLGFDQSFTLVGAGGVEFFFQGLGGFSSRLKSEHLEHTQVGGGGGTTKAV